MEWADVDWQQARNMIKAAKRARPDHGLPNDRRGPFKGTTNIYNRSEVAKTAWAAFDRNQTIATAVAAEHGMSTMYARSLLSAMRKDGWQIPYCPRATHGPGRNCPCEQCQTEPDPAEESTPSSKVTVFTAGSIQLPEAALPMGPWVNEAACRGLATNLFYPERGDPTRHALEVCKPCPVKADCLQYAIDNSERWGVWGGLTERQRRRIRSDRYQARKNTA
jgi:WhiB family redox-sensing transcriptional regulator